MGMFAIPDSEGSLLSERQPYVVTGISRSFYANCIRLSPVFHQTLIELDGEGGDLSGVSDKEIKPDIDGPIIGGCYRLSSVSKHKATNGDRRGPPAAY